ncbi:MAG: hypothetical protein LBI38_01930 [Oscillospiraceae bacterium]|jgi:hypothetical protein|nr:hypothetical protein [Oscillospiraceae bacterium]
MITAEQLQTLKKGSVSVDIEKSNVRIPEAFKSATRVQKAEIIELSGLSKFGFYKASASPKVVITLAQVLNISPYYLTGETDQKGRCDAAALEEFFEGCDGVDKKKAKRKSAAPAVRAKKSAVKEKKSPAVRVKRSAVRVKRSADIDDGSMAKLMEALIIRAKFSKEAADAYGKIKELLLK